MFLFPIIGGFFRRFWGGWENIFPHIVKVVMGYAFMFAIAFFVTRNLYAAICFGVVMGTAFLNPLHSWGMGMGAAPGRSLAACVAVMGGSYGIFTSCAAAGLVYFTGHIVYLLYAITGSLTPLGYIFGYWFFNKFRKNPDGTYRPIWQTSPGVWFLDVPTAVGEVGIGMLLFSL